MSLFNETSFYQPAHPECACQTACTDKGAGSWCYVGADCAYAKGPLRYLTGVGWRYCDPRLEAKQEWAPLKKGGSSPPRFHPLPIRTGGSRLKRIRMPIIRKKRQGMAPYESATDFTLGTVRLGRDGLTYYRVIKSGKTRRWTKLSLK